MIVFDDSLLVVGYINVTHITDGYKAFWKTAKMKLAFVCLCAFFGLTNALFGIGKLQKYAVKGKLLCGTVPASKVKVKLIDDGTTYIGCKQ